MPKYQNWSQIPVSLVVCNKTDQLFQIKHDFLYIKDINKTSNIKIRFTKKEFI